MKKVLVLTLAMVFAFASMALAAEVSGELKSVVKWNTWDGNEDQYGGASLDTASLTVTAAEEGVFDASLTVAQDADDILLDGYELAIYDEYFTANAWGDGTEKDAYATPLAFVEAPGDADNTVRFTSSVFGPEFVADFSDKTARLFAKSAFGDFTVGGAAQYLGAADESTRNHYYDVFGTAAFGGVTVSGEVWFDTDKEDDNTKLGVKATTTVSDVALTGRIKRDNTPANQWTEFYGKAAYEVDAYSASAAYTFKSFENDTDYSKLELDGSYTAVPEFVTVDAAFVLGKDEDGSNGYNIDDVKLFDGVEVDDVLTTEYTKFKVGATVNATSKLTVAPSYTWEKFENADGVNEDKDPDYVVAGDYKVGTLAVDTTYAVTSDVKVKHELKRRSSSLNEADALVGWFNTLGVSVAF